MIGSRYITKIVSVVMAVAVTVCILAMAFSQRLVEAVGGAAIAMEYEAELFDTDEVIRINIRMDEGEWEDMLDRALEENYYSCDVVINGEEICHVGIRPKGNTSLSAIASNPETDRFSLKLEFDHYVEGQTCLGLDKLILNNNYADATNMKEAIVYDMYRYLGADASLCNYAEVSVNGTYRGVYLALEAVEDSFMLRNYGAEDGNLYKPEGASVGGGHGEADGAAAGGPGKMEMGASGGFGMPEAGTTDSSGKAEVEETGRSEPALSGERMEGWDRNRDAGDGRESVSQDRNQADFPQGGFREQRMSAGSGGADLNYTDDALDSYAAIWDGEVTDTGKEDHKRVVEALKHISQGMDLETYLDIDNVLKYMAVHVFSVNLDSLTGNMAHNYYLYESKGMLNIIPWDYNLSFGGMGMGMGGGASGASGVVNDAIDWPFQGTDFFNALLEEETYLSRYHEYLRMLAQDYVLGGGFEAAYNRIRGQIDKLVETDPTAFYSYEEYAAGAEVLYRTVRLRAESVTGQLDGRIPSTDAGQREDSSELVDASDIDISVMGTFDRGGQQGGMDAERRDLQEAFPGGAGFPGMGGEPLEGIDGGPQADMETKQSEGIDGGPQTDMENGPPEEIRGMPQTGMEMEPPEGTDGSSPEALEAIGRAGGWPGGADFPGKGSQPETLEDRGGGQRLQNAALYGVSLAIAVAALCLAKRYRRIHPSPFRG